MLEHAGAISQRLDRHAEFRQHRKLQVGQRRFFGNPEVSPTLDGASAATGHQDRQVDVRVLIAVANSTAVLDHHMVEERTVAIRRRG